MNRDELKEVFLDSVALMNSNEVLAESITKSIEKQRFISEKDNIVYDIKPHYTTKLWVTKHKTFDAARSYDGKVAVLNFASATNPGGGVVHGSSAQEECLCRVSTLYKCLVDKAMWASFYLPHRKEGNNLHNGDIIYTPDVVVFKDDNNEMLPENEWKKIDVITCAAPNLREKQNKYCNSGDSDIQATATDDELYQIHLIRAKKILQAAVFNKIDNIILGAFGCGAFKNNPEVVAKAWKEAVYAFDGYFDNIEFAVYCGWDDKNYNIFDKII